MIVIRMLEMAASLRQALFMFVTVSLMGVTASAQLRLTPCHIEDSPASCGVLRVLENRKQTNGRELLLNVVVLHSVGSGKEKDPLFILDGGPGGAATRLAGFVANALRPVLEDRAVVMVDQRGTGGPNALNCAIADRHFVVPKDKEECLARFAKFADLRNYGTLDFVRDVEDLRKALGYAHINLYGASYGSRVAQIYVREYPGVVRSIVMAAPAPPTMIVPDSLDAATNAALLLAVKRCREEDACAKAFPGLLKIPDDLDDFRRIGLLLLLYSPDTARRVPWLLSHQAAGDLLLVEHAVEDGRQMLTGSLALGLHLSVLCSEDLPLSKEVSGPFLAEYRAACSGWPRSSESGRIHERVSSDVPVLMLTGENDPVTGPGRARELQSDFPNSTIVVIPGGGHMFGGYTRCLDQMIAKFLRGEPFTSACLASQSKSSFFVGR